jgi:hypothetical protein
MLARLLIFGELEFKLKKRTVKFFEIKPLGQLEKSCCSNSTLDVIDFDKTKTIISIKRSETDPKSADALKIIPEKNRVDFIELKGFKKFIENHQQDKTVEEKINTQITDFNLVKKIMDSLYVLEGVIRDRKFNCTKSEYNQYESTAKNYIVVTDIDDPLKNRLFLYNYLAGDGSEKIDTIKHTIMEKLTESTNSILLDGLNRPIILSCNEIDKFYESILAEVYH